MPTKQHILAEIQRTAAGNDGRALGKRRFFSETGIKESDWVGRYWARWGDAVKEAGLEPNRLNEAYSEARLLDALGDLCLELGHFPVIAELRLKARAAPDFPSHNTFQRFGSKKELRSRLQAHAHASGREDIVAICGSAREIEPTSKAVEVGDDVMGDVYLIKSGGYFKIGRSNAAGRREREIALQLPERATRVHTIRTDDPVGIEDYWHRRFAHRRMNGEWFKLTSADVAAFRRRKFM